MKGTQGLEKTTNKWHETAIIVMLLLLGMYAIEIILIDLIVDRSKF